MSAILSSKKIFESDGERMRKRNGSKITLRENNSTNDAKCLICTNFKILAWKVDFQRVRIAYSYKDGNSF